MIILKAIPTLDKRELVAKIKHIFLNFEAYKYNRVLIEFFTNENIFIGDNVLETTFKIQKNSAPIIYEVSGPYDAKSNSYPTIARVFYEGNLIYECDLKPGILQRTAAMTWLYINVLEHKPERILLFGGGNLAFHIASYLKDYIPNLMKIDYNDVEQKKDIFETPLREIGLTVNFTLSPDLSQYDTIIMATNTKDYILHARNISLIKPGTLVISLCTTSQIGEIAEDIYHRQDMNVFLDYPETKTFTADMKKANALGYLEKAILFSDIIKERASFDLRSKVNIVRLSGTPMQNIAVIDMMLEKENLVSSLGNE